MGRIGPKNTAGKTLPQRFPARSRLWFTENTTTKSWKTRPSSEKVEWEMVRFQSSFRAIQSLTDGKSTRKNICADEQNLCRNPGSNQGPLDLQSNALPTELFRHMLSWSPRTAFANDELEKSWFEWCSTCDRSNSSRRRGATKLIGIHTIS